MGLSHSIPKHLRKINESIHPLLIPQLPLLNAFMKFKGRSYPFSVIGTESSGCSKLEYWSGLASLSMKKD